MGIHSRWAWMLACVAFALPMGARAQFATGGVGPYRNNIVWIAWGNNGDRVSGTLTRTNVTPVAGQFLRTTCTASALNGGMFVRTPSGRGLGALYNDTGAGATSTMPIALYGDNATTRTFNLACAATFGPTGTASDPPFAIGGLVVADAEQNAASDEFEQATGPAGTTWRIIDRYRPTSCGFSSAAVAVSATSLRLQGAGASGSNSFCNPSVPGEGQGPMAVAFLEGAASASFSVRGRGTSGIALGVFVNVADLGDAPSSYGTAQHLPQFTWTGGTVTGTQQVNDPAFALATLSTAATIQFGARADTEIIDQPSANANGDDAAGIDDEDALPAGPVVLPSSGAYTLPNVPCTGAGAAVRGYIDWNRDGDFADAGEASAPTTCSGGQTNIAWAPPPVALQGPSFLRLRIAANAVEVASPIGVAGAGEVEDYAVTLVPSRVTLVKRLEGRMRATDTFTVSIEGTSPASVTTTGSGLNGVVTVATPATPVDAGVPLVLRESFVAGEGNFGAYAKSIACVANPGSTGAVPGASVSAENATTAAFTLTPNLGNDLTCTITNVAPDPTFAITKSLTGESGTVAGRAEAGEQLTYMITATNTSQADAVGAVIADPVPAHTTFVSASDGGALAGNLVQWTADIAAGASVTRTVVFQVAAPLPAGDTHIENSATVDDPDDATPPAACATSPCVQTLVAAVPALTLVKRIVAGDPYDAVGDTIDYAYTVTNTGNVTIDALSIADDRIASVQCPATALAPGDDVICMATHTVTQADLDAGTLTNTATARGTPADGVLTPPTASATANAQGLPAWTLLKTAVAGDPYDAVGDLVDYRYVVTNTGNVRIDAMAIADDRIASVSCPVTTIAPGDSATCTALYTVAQADLDAGTVTNHATATGTPTLGILPPATANATVTATGLPALALDKQAVSGNPYDAPGDRVDYEYRVTNTGNVRIDTLSVTDDRIASITCPATTLAPGDSTTCSGTDTITQADLNAGLVTNHANATGTPTLGTLAPATDTETVVSSATAALRVEKSVVSGAPYDAVGDVIAYEYRVSTPNGVQIRSVTVTDDRIASVSCPGTVVEGVMVLLCTGTYTITQADLDAGSVTNIVTVDGVADSGPVVPDTDTATVVATINAAMTLAKSAVAGAPYDAIGDTVAYEYRVTNTGNVTIDALRIADDRIADVQCPATILAPGTSTMCTATYTITQADLDAGSLTNLATASGGPSTLAPVTDSATVQAAATPAFTLDKTAVAGAPYDRIGAVIDYRFVVTNTGNVTLDALSLTDDRIGTITCPTTLLPPGTSTTCLASDTASQADLDAGAITNHATATATPTQGTLTPATDDVTVVATLAPALSLAKTAVAGDPYNQAGAVVDYQYLVTNVGNVTVDAVSVTDDRVAAVQCPPVALASQASVTCTGRYTITQADLDAGAVTNHATATGTPATGTLTPATASATVLATATPILAMVKSIVSGEPYDTLGDVIDYRYVVRNTGNVTIDALSVADDRIADVQCPATTLAPQATVACTARYTVTQADLDAGAVTNIATAAGRPATGTLVPATATATAGALARVTYAKQVDATDPVGAGDVLTYTLTVTIAQSATTQATTLTDTPGPGLRFRSVTSPGAFACNAAAPLVCTLPAGTAPGTYAITYTATVGEDASRVVRNTVTAASAPGDPHPPTCADSCTTETTVREPRVVVTKTATPGTDTEVVVDQVIAYTLTVIVRDAATRTDLVLHDIPDPGLTLGPLPAGCVPSGASIACTLPAGTPAGVHTFAYTATVNAHAGATVGNQVLIVRPLNVNPLPLCLNCAIEHHVGATELRLSKHVAVREAKIGDLVRYTLTVDNIGSGQLTDGIVVDTPPPGFLYVDGSLRTADADGHADVVPGSPLRFTGVDIAPGGSATLVYLLRVGAAVRPGTQANHAQVFAPDSDVPISNEATAEVTLAGDPLLEDALVFGTVFEDRDADGWQDVGECGLPGVRIASVEGLLVETDAWGRYHLVDIDGGPAERGRNFLLKVDPATLPVGWHLTTDNPLLRRITPGLPVRFDWGAQAPPIVTHAPPKAHGACTAN